MIALSLLCLLNQLGCPPDFIRFIIDWFSQFFFQLFTLRSLSLSLSRARAFSLRVSPHSVDKWFLCGSYINFYAVFFSLLSLYRISLLSIQLTLRCIVIGWRLFDRNKLLPMPQDQNTKSSSEKGKKKLRRNGIDASAAHFLSDLNYEIAVCSMSIVGSCQTNWSVNGGKWWHCTMCMNNVLYNEIKTWTQSAPLKQMTKHIFEKKTLAVFYSRKAREKKTSHGITVESVNKSGWPQPLGLYIH